MPGQNPDRTSDVGLAEQLRRGLVETLACLKQEISDQTSPRWYWTDVEDRVARRNRILRGWSNYFCLGPVGPTYRAIDRHARYRLRQWLCGKHKLKGGGTTRYPAESLHEMLGLVRLSDLPKSFPWAKA